jgi:hypothetical protein
MHDVKCECLPLLHALVSLEAVRLSFELDMHRRR